MGTPFNKRLIEYRIRDTMIDRTKPHKDDRADDDLFAVSRIELNTWLQDDALLRSPEPRLHNADRNESEDRINEVEPSPLEYARLKGLARNHLEEGYYEIEDLQNNAIAGLLGDSHLPQFILGDELKVQERMSILKEGASLYASITQQRSQEIIDSLTVPMMESLSRHGRMKLELPLLRSDHQLDCDQFGRREGFEVHLQQVKLPLEAVDLEKSQGLSWPARFWKIGDCILEELKAEKVGVSKSTVKVLQDSLNPIWTKEDSKTLWKSELKYKKDSALEHVTPPISPIYVAPPQYDLLETDCAFNVPTLSDPVSPTGRQLEIIEGTLFKQDLVISPRHYVLTDRQGGLSDTCMAEETVKLKDIYSPLASLENSSPLFLPESEHSQLQGLKVGQPLTPKGPLIAVPKEVRFSEIIEELMFEVPQSHFNSPTNEAKFFEDMFGPAEKVAKRKLEKEMLVEADATARVDVPVMDFSKPDPPWKAFEIFEGQQISTNTTAIQKKYIRDVVGQNWQSIPKWTGSQKGDMMLRWLPFHKEEALLRAALKEKIEVDLALFIDNSPKQFVIDSSSLVWKPAGLMILRKEMEDEDDDELEPRHFQTNIPLDLASLVKKRKRELQTGPDSQNDCHSLVHSLGGVSPIFPRQTLPVGVITTSMNTVSTKQLERHGQTSRDLNMQKETKADQSEQKLGSLLGGPFSATNFLDNYLEIRGSKKSKYSNSSYFEARTAEDWDIQSSSMELQNPISHEAAQEGPVANLDSFPTPSIPIPRPKSSIIVASALVKNRTLFKNIEIHLPNVQLVERDFAAHNTIMWIEGSVARSPLPSPLDSEADFLISASTGIVITTIQKIKQKRLPGQKGKTAIRDRIERMCLRYEKLIILVSEGSNEKNSKGLDVSDCDAFSEFVGFTLGLGTSISVQLVVGGELVLSKWISSTIVRNQAAEPVNIVTEESYWEIFLRHAGMNTFAAQSIIDGLKPPENVDNIMPTKMGLFGLSAFVEMGGMQRTRRFDCTLGRTLIERVSGVIDEEWKI